MNRSACIASLFCALAVSAASADVLINSGNDLGFFTPFNTANANTVHYGDSWWVGFDTQPYTLTSVTLHLATFNAPSAGSTDINLTINDGDPSGLVFGSGAPLYTTTFTGVSLPNAFGAATYFDVTIPLPNITTQLSFNNVGFGISLSNFNFSGDFGFQVASGATQTAGFYTNNASFYDGSSWSLFSFGTNPANYSVTFEGTRVPTPSAASALLLGIAAASRRRR